MPEMQRKSLASPPTSCPEPAGMSLRDDMVLFLSCIAEGWRDSSNGGIAEAFLCFGLILYPGFCVA